jgi:hypothetical protein
LKNFTLKKTCLEKADSKEFVRRALLGLWWCEDKVIILSKGFFEKQKRD